MESTIEEPMQENKGVPQDEGAPQNEEAQPIQDQPMAEEPRQSRSGRVLRRTQRLEESYMRPQLKSLLSKAVHSEVEQNKLPDRSINNMCKLCAHGLPASIADNDTMYLREAMQQEDKDEFLKAMVKEIEDHTRRGHWRLTTVDKMRRRNYKHKPIMAIWSFK